MTGRVWQLPDLPAAPCWPVSLQHADVLLAPYRVGDIGEWMAVRTANVAWLSPWDATDPHPGQPRMTTRQRVRYWWGQARQGACVPWLIRAANGASQGSIIGQCTVSNIVYGSARTASMGYWIAQKFAGRGIVPTAVAMATDYAMKVMGLHRVEIAIRPENAPSLRVVDKLGFREEGLRPRFIHIAGQWRDHRVFALTREEIPDGLVPRLAAGGTRLEACASSSFDMGGRRPTPDTS